MEKPNLDTQINDLQNQANKLHHLICCEPDILKKRPLMRQRSQILEKVGTLREKQNAIEQTIYTKKLNDLISENRDFIFFSVNNRRIQIQENGTVEVTFSPCKHKHKFPIKQLLTNYRVNPNHREGDTFGRWQRMMINNETYSGGMNCRQCRKDKEKRFAKLRRYNNKPIGRLSWILRKLQ